MLGSMLNLGPNVTVPGTMKENCRKASYWTFYGTKGKHESLLLGTITRFLE